MAGLSFRAERDVINGLFAARIDATRHSVTRQDRVAAIRALYDELRAALRALTLRRQLMTIAQREARRLMRDTTKNIDKTIPYRIPIVT